MLAAGSWELGAGSWGLRSKEKEVLNQEAHCTRFPSHSQNNTG